MDTHSFNEISKCKYVYLFIVNYVWCNISLYRYFLRDYWMLGFVEN